VQRCLQTEIPPDPSRRRLWLVAAVLIGAITGCVSRAPVELPASAEPVELAATPFFPQQIHQCGPAALATVLVASGVEVSPEELARQTYLPGRRGSLQLELIAAARRHGRIPYELDGGLDAVSAELEAGHPVLVLQDLGIGPLHVWHYAVVIGLARDPSQLLLRSGRDERLQMPLARFVKTCDKAQRWAVVTLPPEQLPATADSQRYIESVLPLEETGDYATAAQAYATALTRWPHDPVALFGLASAQYHLGDLPAAQAGYLAALAVAPGNPLVLNNLAEVSLARGCAQQAARFAAAAQAHLPADAEMAATVADTQARIEARAAQQDDAPDCPR
jgi:tetratricopeptide (TPR) repeat protein